MESIINEKHEYGIALLKPDGVERGILPKLLAYIQEDGMEIIKHKVVQLHKEDVFRNFVTDFDMNKVMSFSNIEEKNYSIIESRIMV
ncbi:nucleoside-diphosphate kinase [Fervidibacillus albus]|uniref:Nucleoside diphosphate kinase-like domain-containing protein n=1 Tax=Fervidibacillus albus TaxID=2980026 RepID=A0A9E8LSK4_9BACI|nr:nucleoside-diphosphate kinase [Fervidibacillus albus]WAA08818.1 hypothetical protein OE104_09365 [Fervidibacillus albus]